MLENRAVADRPVRSALIERCAAPTGPKHDLVAVADLLGRPSSCGDESVCETFGYDDGRCRPAWSALIVRLTFVSALPFRVRVVADLNGRPPSCGARAAQLTMRRPLLPTCAVGPHQAIRTMMAMNEQDDAVADRSGRPSWCVAYLLAYLVAW